MGSPFTNYTGSEENYDRETFLSFEAVIFQSPFLSESHIAPELENALPEAGLNEYEMMEYQVAPGVPVTKIGDAVFAMADNTRELSDEFREPVASGNPLVVILPKDRILHISKNFLVGEFAQAQAGKYKFNFSRIDPLLVDNLQRLRSFFGYPFAIVDGYYSPKYLKEVLKIHDAGKINRDPHITGRGVKINVPGYNGMIKQIAVAAIVACDRDINLGIGISTMTLSVKQPLVNTSEENSEDRQRITSYIPDEKTMVSAYTFCIDVKRLLYTHFGTYEKSMQKALSALTVFILKYHYNPDAIPADWFDWEKPITDTISFMSGKSITNDPEVILYCLAYSSFGYLYRYFLKEKSLPATVNSIINDLTTHIDRSDIHRPDSFLNLQKAPDKKAFIENCMQRILVGKKADGSSFHLAPATFFDWKNNPQDTSFYKKLSSLIRQVKTNGVPAQQFPEGGTVSNLKLTPPNPDKPVHDFTGRYYAEFPNHTSLYGRWLLINQAGNYISGKLCGIFKGPVTKLKNTVTEFYGRIDDKGNVICNVYPQQTLIIKTAQKETRLYIVDNRTDKIILNVPVISKAKNPVISGSIINSFTGINQDLLVTVAWIHPLPDQLRKFFDSFKTSEKDVTEAIRSYYNENEAQEGLRKTKLRGDVVKLDVAINNYLSLPPMFNQFAAYYTKYYYSVLPHWRPRNDKESMSESGWIKKMLEDYRDLRGTANIQEFKKLYEYFGVDTRIPDVKYQYQIKIELNGISVGPGGRSSGTITIENKTDFKKYPKAAQWTSAQFSISLWSATVSLNPLNWVPKISIGQTIEAELTTGILYIPSDFSDANVQITEGKAFEIPVGGSSGGVKASTKAGYSSVIILIDGHGKGTLAFSEQGFSKPDTLEIEPAEPSGEEDPYAKIAGFLPSLTMYKGSIGTRTTSLDIVSVPVPESFGATYQVQNTRYFKHDDATLSPQAVEAVGKLCAEELVGFSDPKSVLEIYGHADASGDPGYNLTLSKYRADNVLQAIKDRLGKKLITTNISVKGMGEIEANKKYGQYTEKNAWLRRVVIILNGRAVLSLGEL